MVNIVNIVSSDPKLKTGQHLLRGTGTVIQQGSGVVLDTGKELLPLDPSVLNYVGNRDQVTFEINNATITLIVPRQQSFGSDVPGINDADIYFTGSTTIDASPSPQSLHISQLQQTSLHLFQDAPSALAFIRQFAAGSIEDEIQAIIDRNGCVIIALDGTSQAVQQCAVLDNNDAVRLIQLLQAGMKNSVLSSLPAESLMTILSESGTISLAGLSAFDTLLAGMQTTVAEMRAGSVAAQNEILTSWLRTSLESGLTLPAAMSLLPETSSDSVVSEIDAVMTALRSISRPTAVPDDYLLDEHTVSTVDRTSLFEKAVSRLGYTLEHTLVVQNDSPALPATLKSLLLTLEGQLITGEGLRQDQIKPLPDVSSSASFLPTLSTTHESVSPVQASQDSTVPARTHLPRLQIVIREIEDFLKNYVSADLQSGHSETESEQTTSPAGIGTVHPRDDGTDFIAQIRTFAAEISSFANDTSGTAGRLAGSYPQSAGSPVLSAFDDIRKHLDELDSFLAALPPDAETDVVLSSALSPENDTYVLKHLMRLRDSLVLLDRIISFSGAESGTENGNTERPDRLSSPGLHRASIPAEEEAPVAGGIRHFDLLKQLHSAVRSFESLQLLAREHPTSEGTRQIFALPVKIGNDINEVVVRLHTFRKKRRNGGRQNRVTADVAVAPSSTGAVQTHLDYHRSSSLKVSMRFERKGTMQWFIRQQNDIVQALQRHFRVPVSLSLGKLHPHAESAGGDSHTPRALIDLKG